MSRAQDPHKPFFPFGNPFRMLSPKGSYLSPRLLELLNTFEGTLTETLRKLTPSNNEDVLSLLWMKRAMESLCTIHTDIKSLITSLELPTGDWDEKWVHVYLDNSVKLLDICIAFGSEISKLSQGHLHLQYAVHSCSGSSSNRFTNVHSSLDSWRQHVNSKNQGLDNCFEILDNLVKTLDLPKVKNSAKGKVLMRAMYGLKVVTIFVCNAFSSGFSGSAKNLTDLHLPETFLWSDAFTNLQSVVNGEIRNLYSCGKATVLKELEDVDNSVKKLYPIIVQDGEMNVEKIEAFKNLVSELSENANKLSQGLDVLSKEVDEFFQIVLMGRDALLCNLRVGTKVWDPTQQNGRVEGGLVR